MTPEELKVWVDSLTTFGGWGSCIAVILYFLTFPEKAEKLSSIFFKLLRTIWKGAEKKYIAHDIQGRVNDYVKNYLNKEIKGFEPSTIKLTWVSEEQDRETFLKKGSLIVRMRKSNNQNKNFVHASMIYISETLLKKTKRYISPKQRESIDLFVANKLFEKEKRDILLPFIDDYLLKGTSDQKIREYFNTFNLIDTVGLFFPLFIQEMTFLGEKVFAKGKDPRIHPEVAGLVKFLNTYAERKSGEDIETNFEGEFCKFGIMIVGKGGKISQRGTEPYTGFIKVLISKGVETIYLLGNEYKKKFIHDICLDSFLGEIKFSIFNEKKYTAKIPSFIGGKKVDSKTYMLVLRKNKLEHYIS